jgi:hypothetical protein
MMPVKTKFTLHSQYEDFKLNVLRHELKNLDQSTSKDSIIFLSLKAIFAGFMLLAGVCTVYFLAIVPFLFQHFSHETTAQVIECEMIKTKQYGPVPSLTYTYIWNDQPFVDHNSIYGYGMPECDSYLNQTAAIRVLEPDPNQTRLIAAETSHPVREDIGMFIAGLSMGAFGAIGLYLFLYAIVQNMRAKHNFLRHTRSGVLLEGEIISIHGNRQVTTQAYIVTIVYGFEAHKQYLTGRAEARRDDLYKAPLPPVGTPIAVLYADDHAHMML